MAGRAPLAAGLRISTGGPEPYGYRRARVGGQEPATHVPGHDGPGWPHSTCIAATEAALGPAASTPRARRTSRLTPLLKSSRIA